MPESTPIHLSEPPRLVLAQLPTPVVELPNLARHVSVPRLLLKRDDLTGLETSGNKIRKLEYLIADGVRSGADTLVTHGGFQSNHCRATAAAAARLGLRCRLLLRSPENPANDGNLFLDRLFGAAISLHSPAEYAERRKELIDRATAEESAAGRTPYFFPVGGSVPLGCWGYVRCFHEMLSQFAPGRPIDVYVAVSSSGTLAGLILGKALFKADHVRVVGIPVSDSVEFFQADVRKLIDDTTAAFGLGLSVEQTPVELVDGYIGEGYAIPTPRSIEMIKLLARTEGILLDPTYTSKAMVGFLDQAAQAKVRPGATPLFVHTGGVFGLMARRDLFDVP
jgi:D-cysteine desulfhydrase